MINLFGLAVGIACCILVLLHVKDELSYDQFLGNEDQLYRVTIDAKLGEQEINAPLSPAPMAEALISLFPEVEAAARIFRSSFVGAEGVNVTRDEKRFIEERFFYVDSTLFDVMSYRFIAGDKDAALSAPNSIVLTERMATKYFGTEDPINKTLRIDNQADYRVTAIVQDVPDQAHWHFDFLASLSTLPISKDTRWVSNPFSTYLLLKPGQDVNVLETKLQRLVDEHIAEQFQSILGLSVEQFVGSGGRYNFALQRVADVHLHSQLDYEFEANGNIKYVYIFSIIAFLILMIACFNFMNLSTARSANRAKEVGIRKALGSFRKQLIGQFLFESIILCVLALGIGLMLVKLSLPAFNTLLGKNIAVAYLSGFFLPVVIGFVLLLGLLAGSYPAFFLTSFNTISVIKGKRGTGSRNSRLRSTLVVFQFAISIVLMIGTAIVYQQVDFIQSKGLGFDKDHVVIVERGAALGSNRETFKHELMKSQGVIAAAGLDNLPGSILNDDTFRPVGSPPDQLQVTWVVLGDYDIIKALNIAVIEGRDFTREAPRDSSVLIVNKAAAKQLRFENAVGEQVTSPFANPNQPDRIYDIVGVMGDVHFESLHQEIKPLVIELASDSNPLSYLAIKIRPDQMAETIADIEDAWQAFVPGEPFEYAFLDQRIGSLYQADRQTGQMVGIFSGLAIMIACLGLFGLAAFIAESRVKEVGIRKVLGASVSGIVRLFTQDFLKLVVFAFLLAAPIAFLVMRSWLEAFAYRIDISWMLFVMVGGIAVLIAFATVCYQSMRAALINPVDALRAE